VSPAGARGGCNVSVALLDPLPEIGYLPIDDEILRRVIAAAGVLAVGLR
jgi:hypothetical protein